MTSITNNSVDKEIDRFRDLYRTGRMGWHKPTVNPKLIKHINLFPQPDPGSPQNSPLVCVPLCGQSLDVPYLLNLGYRVFGIESAPEAIQNLNTESQLNLTFDPVTSTYSNPDRTLVIFLGDVFKCPESYGQWDAVWDRASLSVFPEDLRTSYVQVVRRGLKSEFTYLLSVYEYDPILSVQPPRAVLGMEIDSVFGSWSKVTQVSKESVLGNFAHLHGVELEQIIYMFRPK